MSYKFLKETLLNLLVLDQGRVDLFQKRLSKLKKNPKKFFQDSRFNVFTEKYKIVHRSFAGEASGVEHQTQMKKDTYNSDMDIIKQTYVKNLRPLKDGFDFQYMIDGLKEYKVSGVYIMPQERGLKPALCILESDKESFINNFFLFYQTF